MQKCSWRKSGKILFTIIMKVMTSATFYIGSARLLRIKCLDCSRMPVPTRFKLFRSPELQEQLYGIWYIYGVYMVYIVYGIFVI